MHCTNCGGALATSITFCPSCGRAIAQPATAPSAQPAPALHSNAAGSLCYVLGFLTGIFFLAMEPYKQDRFVRFHAFQSIFLSVAWFVVYFVLGVALAVLPGFLWRVGWMMQSLLGLLFFLLWVLLMYKAYNNERFRLPVIGDLAAKRA